MNQRKFLHLLNLYIDGEIPSADAAELEKEIIANPKRRKIYDDYCRIHRATKMVYERFREAAASQNVDGARLFQGDAQAPRLQSEGRGSRSRRTSWLGLLGGVAAAASVALVLNFNGGREDTAVISDTRGAVAVQADPEAEPAIAAPFAAEVRSDPYLSQEPATRSSPFSLASTSQEPEIVWSNASTTSTGSAAVQISSPFGIITPSIPADGPVAPLTPDETKPASERVFRSGSAVSQPELEPVGFTIHR